MPYEFKLPDVGEGVAEGEIRRWLVKEGDAVVENQPLVEVMTDKVTVELPSPREGRVQNILAREGQVVKVGSPIIIISEKDDKSLPKREEATKGLAAAPAPSPVLATPSTRRLARELGIDISNLQGSGPGGRVIEQDVRQFASAGGAEPGEAKTIDERVPLRGVQRRMAESMAQSARTTSPFTLVDDVDMSELISARELLSLTGERKGVKMTYLPFVIKAVTSALKEFPYLNSSLDEEKGEVILRKTYNIGVAVAAEGGLVVPVIKDADRKGIFVLAREVEELAAKAREQKLELDEIKDATFTITSLGSLGGLFATPIIHLPEVAILGVHRITKRPVVKDSEIVVRDIAHLSLSVDHRVIDGATAARFTDRVKNLIENPSDLLSEL